MKPSAPAAAAPSRDGWHARLALHCRRDDDLGDGRCVVRAEHAGPLRVLKTLYPEGPGIGHAVIVHPPGGVVGGDALEIDLDLDVQAHLLVTTPGATRFYRSAGAPASQTVCTRLAARARLEWLPLETIAHRGCLARSVMAFDLAAGAEMIGCDVLALGAPAAGEAFDAGRFEQLIELAGHWLERGVIDGTDARLLASPLGFAGRRALATLWFAAGSAIDEARRDALLETARDEIAAHEDRPEPAVAHEPTAPATRDDCAQAAAPRRGAAHGLVAGATSPQPRVVVLRVLAHRVEPALALARAVWARWRSAAWRLDAAAPRIWRT